MLSQLCRAQLWPKPSRKWNRRFSRGIQRKLGPGHINAPNIVHFNCSTNNLQGIPDHCSDYGGDSSCCSDEENDCSSGGFDDTCSEYSCSTSMPLDRECCCCCQVAENPAYGLSTLEPHIPQFSAAEDKVSANNITNHQHQAENEYIPLWNTRQQPSRDKIFKIIPPKEEESRLLQSQDLHSAPHSLTAPRITDSRKTTRLRGVLSERDSPSAFRVVTPKSDKIAAQNVSKPQCLKNVPANHPLSVRVMQSTPKRQDKAEQLSRKTQRARAYPTKLKRFSVCDADETLRKASKEDPAQVPMVVMQCARLHLSLSSNPPFQQMSLPMGTLVTALFRDEDWICVQTPHGVKGYLFYTNCTPLGILPASTKLEPWETPYGANRHLLKRLDDEAVLRNQNQNRSDIDTQSAKKSNVRLQARNRENGAARIKYDNRVRRTGSSGIKQPRMAHPSKTNVENVRATLQRNLSSQKAAHDTDTDQEAKKILEKNIDKLISSVRTTKPKDDCSDMAMQLKTLRIESIPTEERNGMSNV
ncbi:uncharacterized protein LOC135371251 isoform X2 [Ornithodoros turicata]